MKRFIALLAAVIATSAGVSGPSRASGTLDNICLAKINTSFRLMELYVETDDVDSLTSMQLDMARRACADLDDPRFAQCQNNLFRIVDLAQDGQGLKARELMVDQGAPACASYMEMHDAPKQAL